MNRDAAVGQAFAVGGDGDGAGAGTAGEGVANAAFPNADAQVGAIENLYDLHIGAFGEQRVIFDTGAKVVQVNGCCVIHEEAAMRVAHSGGSGGAVDRQVHGVYILR